MRYYVVVKRKERKEMTMTTQKNIESLANMLMDADNAVYDEMNIDKVSSFTAPEFAARAATKAVKIIRSRDYEIADIQKAADILDAENYHRMARAVRFVIAENIPYNFI